MVLIGKAEERSGVTKGIFISWSPIRIIGSSELPIISLCYNFIKNFK